MIPLCIPNLGGNEARYLQECVDSNFVSSVGPFVDRFEADVASATGAAHAVATTSGSAGLHAALTAVGVGRDDLVLLPSFTFIASANAIAQCGASPWLLDIDEATWGLDPQALEVALTRETERRGDALLHRASGRRVAAIVPVHCLGLPCDMDPIIRVARAYGLPVVADAAAAIGASYRDRPIGQLGADLSVLSFNGNKTVTAGGGGAVLSNEASLAARVRHLTTTARVGSGFDHDRVGFNYRMTNLQAAVGCAQIEQLDAFVAAKRRIARQYDVAFSELLGVRAFPTPDWARSACWFSGLSWDGRDAEELVPLLQAEGIAARAFWKPMSEQVPYRSAPREPTPVCDRIWRSVLTLPCSSSLTSDDQAAVIAALRKALERDAEVE
ncbi:MAG: aminotransferase class I/II-fold pyridoxal phosphate-dependent enzyme [Deltaproteobacteria bacterium]|nr:aminotransferase class I/II-fold pyridoxal phosphate-dependent enzyme [Deltaproteobacteria bacterium]MBW2361508.1 aminotransferase class I/II-fold pyridoxal phosphate-dependent enzyme [Deltaproteobacteria bacterium]